MSGIGAGLTRPPDRFSESGVGVLSLDEHSLSWGKAKPPERFSRSEGLQNRRAHVRPTGKGDGSLLKSAVNRDENIVNDFTGASIKTTR